MNLSNETLSITKAYKLGIQQLKEAQIEAPAREAGALLCFAAKIDYSKIFSHGEDELPREVRLNYFDLLEKRCKHVPFQHLLEHQEFMSLDFYVNSDVLVPREDTEILVELVLAHIENYKNSLHYMEIENDLLPNSYITLSILDIGTGSGCISISLAHYANNVKVFAVDISKKALEVASKNAIQNNVSDKFSFINLDVLSEGFETALQKFSLKAFPFDIIVSNPPYIPSKDIPTLQPEVAIHEPIGALDGGADGLDFYRCIIEKSDKLLKTGGLLAFEVGIGQAKDISILMSDSYENISIQKDLSEIDRVVFGFKR